MTAWNDFETELRSAASVFPICQTANLVFGVGNRDARAVLIGEAPGAQEDRQERPFVGPAGKMLDGLLSEAGIARESVWITNVVKCRPTLENNGRLKNRPPSREEFDLFLPWLERELSLLEPQVLVALGATAAKALLDRRSIRMADARGRWHASVFGIDTLVTYHPSFLMRRTTQREDRYRETVADLRLVAERIS